MKRSQVPAPLPRKTGKDSPSPASRLLLSTPFLAFVLLGGCSKLVLFDPKGPVGESERFIILTAFLLMLLVVVPVICLAIWFAWRYRVSSRTDHGYDPKWSYSHHIELAIWIIPLIIVTALGALVWKKTYQLDPYRPIETEAKPINIDVVALDWKWLFIYPDEDIAVVGELVFPTGAPLALRLTSDTVMTSFFIPQLGSQLYAMAGMQTRLHLLADKAGTFFGQNQQFSGTGYSSMTFNAIATTPEEYSAWLDKLRKAPEALDLKRYEELAKPTSGYPVTYFSSVEPALFNSIIQKYMSSGAAGRPKAPDSQPAPRRHPSPDEHSRAMRGEYGMRQ